MDVQTSLLGLDTPVGKTVSQAPVNSEIALPEGRDAAGVLSAHASVTIDEAVCAGGGVKTTGTLEVFLLCQSMAGDVYGFSAVSAFSHTIELAGTQAEHRALVTGQVVELSARPDALHVKLAAVLEFSALVTAPVTTPVITNLSGGVGVERRLSTVTVRRRALLAEASLTIREEVDAKGVERVLLSEGAAQVTSLSYSGASTCEAEGTMFVTALVQTESGESRSMPVELPFVCSFDASFLPSVWAEATVSDLSAVAADVSFGVLDVAAGIKLRLYGAEQVDYDVVLDAYDAGATFQCATERFERLSCEGLARCTADIAENVSIPKHMPDALSAVYASAMPVVVNTFDRDGRLGADVMLLTNVVYRADDGRLYGFTEDIPAQISFDAAYCADAIVNVFPLCVTAAGGGRTLSVRYLLDAHALICRIEPVTLATDLQAGAQPCPYKGILVYCAEAGETVWDVGKRFSVPLGTLRDWNAALSDPLEEGRAIVLMK